MGLGQKNNRILVPEARPAMERFKYEAAQEVGLNVQEGAYWGDYPSRQCGAVGGHMVRKMIREYQQQLAQNNPQQTYTGTTTTAGTNL